MVPRKCWRRKRSPPKLDFRYVQDRNAICQRDANDPSKVYDFTLTTWYAPAVDHWVKREQKIRFEGHLRESNLFELLEYEFGAIGRRMRLAIAAALVFLVSSDVVWAARAKGKRGSKGGRADRRLLAL